MYFIHKDSLTDLSNKLITLDKKWDISFIDHEEEDYVPIDESLNLDGQIIIRYHIEACTTIVWIHHSWPLITRWLHENSQPFYFIEYLKKYSGFHFCGQIDLSKIKSYDGLKSYSIYVSMYHQSELTDDFIDVYRYIDDPKHELYWLIFRRDDGIYEKYTSKFEFEPKLNILNHVEKPIQIEELSIDDLWDNYCKARENCRSCNFFNDSVMYQFENLPIDEKMKWADIIKNNFDDQEIFLACVKSNSQSFIEFFDIIEEFENRCDRKLLSTFCERLNDFERLTQVYELSKTFVQYFINHRPQSRELIIFFLISLRSPLSHIFADDLSFYYVNNLRTVYLKNLIG